MGIECGVPRAVTAVRFMTEGAIIQLPQWLKTPAGEYLLAWEQRHLDQAVADMAAMSVEESLTALKKIFNNAGEGMSKSMQTKVVEPVLKEIMPRLENLDQVGLGYLNLSRSMNTLSGGEVTRVRLASQLSAGLTGVIYILDEPTTGLSFHDVDKLLVVLNKLVDMGNSVLLIEHNLDVIKQADWIIDLGPEGGDRGGEVIAVGTPEQVASIPQSYTGHFLKSHLAEGLASLPASATVPKKKQVAGKRLAPSKKIR